MKKVSAMRIMNEVFDSLKEYEQITENQSSFIKRILDDCVYGDKKIQDSTIQHFKDLYPEMFINSKGVQE